jgi:hypothetical protein
VVGLAACGDDKKTDVNSVVEDGFFVVGEASGYTSPDNKARLASGKNEAASNAERAGMYDGYVWLEKGKGFNLVEVSAQTITNTYGGAALSVKDAGSNGDEEPQVAWYEGSIAAAGAAFQLPSDAQNGLYHVVADKTLNKVVVVPVSYWAMPGDAVKGWNDDQKLEIDGTPSKDKVVYKAEDVPIKASGAFKFRHSGAWKVTLDGTAGSEVRANTNYGGSIDDLVAGGSDISGSAALKGKYTVTMTWTAGSGYIVELTNKQVLANTDWSEVKFGLRGEAGFDGGTIEWSENAQQAVLPTHSTSGDVYTWTITWDLVAGKEFKVAGGDTWLGKSAFDGVSNFADLFEGDDNIKAKENGNYTFTLTIDADNNDSKSFAIVKNN